MYILWSINSAGPLSGVTLSCHGYLVVYADIDIGVALCHCLLLVLTSPLGERETVDK